MRRLLNDAVRTLAPPGEDRHGPLPPLMLTLTVVTGLVDAVSYLALGHVFVANMTGNVVFLGFALVGTANLSALASAVALAAFLFGALAGGRLGTRFATHRGNLLKTATAVQTVLVAVTVAAVAVTGGRITTGVQYALIVFLGLSMGLQNAVARRLGVPDLTTTVLTLTLTGLAADSILAGGAAPRPGRRILSVLAVLLGAFVGAQLVLHGHLVLTLSLALMLLALTSAATHRLSAGDPAWTRPLS
ncbi:YoaK family protein [Streptomyces shenzhenensis]|uniref:YoaK family protein n=1 Tax=Streptomyces shenzhenensis TaxID=943815 RepID=UPI001F3F26B8|nr:YoaK family protein [Streptomyces shenzhenensis]